MVSLSKYLELAESFKGTDSYLGFGSVVKAVCGWYDISVEYDDTHITVNAIESVIEGIQV